MGEGNEDEGRALGLACAPSALAPGHCHRGANCAAVGENRPAVVLDHEAVRLRAACSGEQREDEKGGSRPAKPNTVHLEWGKHLDTLPRVAGTWRSATLPRDGDFTVECLEGPDSSGMVAHSDLLDGDVPPRARRLR